ncbi:MAG TPA: DUF3899 domain-containing protein [Candidatus Limiplasma sp.]|nr:DUF3899 domain-containing protein [Candidatus Limiplasma sp.]
MKSLKVWKRYLITFLIGAAETLLMLLVRGSFGKTDILERYRDISDSLFIAGCLLAGMGGLIFVSENGVFNMIKFGVIKVVSMIRSEKHRAETPKTYYDYLQGEAEKPSAKYGYLLMNGLIFITAAVLFAFM